LSTQWQISWTGIPGPSAKKATLSTGGRPITFAEALDCWIHDEAFRTFFLAELRRVPFSAFFWELPALGSDTLGRPYEHVVLDGELLERTAPDPTSFTTALQADTGSEWVASFPNIGGDAILVVPKPLAGHPGYGHFAAFLRAAPQEQQHALLQTLGRAARTGLQRPDNRVWISTAGLGVPWLHVRLDSKPKYYKHHPYRTT